LSILLSLWCVPRGDALADPGAEAERVVRQATDAVYRTLREQCHSIEQQPERLYALIEEILLPYADFDRMTHWVLGKYSRRVSEQQRRDLITEFRDVLIRTYATAIQTVAPEDIHYLPVRETGKPDQAVVRTEIRQPGEAVVHIDYYMYQNGSQWLVYDIRVEGISLVINYRVSFASEIDARGITGLIESLKQQNQKPMSADTAKHIRSLQADTCK